MNQIPSGYVYVDRIKLGNLCRDVLTVILKTREDYDLNFFSSYMVIANALINARNNKWYVKLFKMQQIKQVETPAEAREFRRSRHQFYVNEYESDLLKLGTKLLHVCKQDIHDDILVTVENYYKLTKFRENPSEIMCKNMMTDFRDGIYTTWVY